MTPIELEAGGGGGWELGRGGAVADTSLLILFPKPIEGVLPALFRSVAPPRPRDPGWY